MSQRSRRFLVGALLLAALGASVSLSAFPIRTWLDQRRTIESSQAELAELDSEVAELRSRITALSSPEEIERLARESYDMVRPGEEAYGILPAPLEPLAIPPGWPFTTAPIPPPP